MYDNFEEAINHRRFTPKHQAYPIVKLNDPYAVEPWEKNTLEI